MKNEKRMTKQKAVGILLRYVESDIIAGGFDQDPEYAEEMQAIEILKTAAAKAIDKAASKPASQEITAQERGAWIAYCTTCQKEIYNANNGAFVQAAAQRHADNNEGHFVITGSADYISSQK